MAGDWIKMRTVLQTCPKVVRMASATNADRLRTVGALHAVWCLFDAHSEDGMLHGYTPQILDEMIGWPGFTKAMGLVDWIVIGENSLTLPEFDSHNGQSAKRRAQESDRKRQVRLSAKTSAIDADKNGTREEKRREENIYTHSDAPTRSEQHLESKQPSTRFKKPTFDDLANELSKRGLSLATAEDEARKFLVYFEQVGWVVGRTKKPMKSWPHAVTIWMRNMQSPGPEKTMASRTSRDWAQ